MTSDHPDTLLDELAITRLLQDWCLWRDTAQWDKLRAAYAPGAWMRTTWFDGPAEGFVEASKAMAGKGALVQHFIGASTVRVAGDRAAAETRVQLLLRDRLQDIAVDVTCHGRFVDQLVRLDGRWCIQHREPIYEKDTIAAVDPAQALHIDAAVLANYPGGYRHLAHLQASSGARIVLDLPPHQSAAQARLYESIDAWLRGGPA